MKNKPLQYSCSVYSSYPGGLEEAYLHVADLTGQLLLKGERIFSPIAHCHEAAQLNDLPTSFDWWMDYDEGFIDKCDSVLVAMMPLWRESKGITHEIAYAKTMLKTVRYLNVDTMEITNEPN